MTADWSKIVEREFAARIKLFETRAADLRAEANALRRRAAFLDTQALAWEDEVVRAVLLADEDETS